MRDMFDGIPSSFPDQLQAYIECSRVIRLAAATTLQPSLKIFLSSIPQSSLVEKQDMAKSLNLMARELGISFASPSNGEPARLLATPQKSPHSERGRFQFQMSRIKGKLNRYGGMHHLGELKLIPRNEGFEYLENWLSRITRNERTR